MSYLSLKITAPVPTMYTDAIPVLITTLQHLQHGTTAHHSRHHRNTSHDHHHTPNKLIFFPLCVQQWHTITHLSRMTFCFTKPNNQRNTGACSILKWAVEKNLLKNLSGWQRKNIGRRSAAWEQRNEGNIVKCSVILANLLHLSWMKKLLNPSNRRSLIPSNQCNGTCFKNESTLPNLV